MTLTPPPVSGLQLVASTGPAGVALQNATPTFLSWTAPNDGQMHRFFVVSSINVVATETGGNIQVAFNDPSGAADSFAQHGPNLAAGTARSGPLGGVCQAGGTVTVRQSTALTLGGPSTFWADIWAE